MNKSVKELMEQCILLAMEKVRGDLKITAKRENVETYAKAIKYLAEAYAIIKRS